MKTVIKITFLLSVLAYLPIWVLCVKFCSQQAIENNTFVICILLTGLLLWLVSLFSMLFAAITPEWKYLFKKTEELIKKEKETEKLNNELSLIISQARRIAAERLGVSPSQLQTSIDKENGVTK